MYVCMYDMRVSLYDMRVSLYDMRVSLYVCMYVCIEKITAAFPLLNAVLNTRSCVCFSRCCLWALLS